MFEVSLKVYQIVLISCCICLQLCILSFYGSYKVLFGSDGSNSLELGFNLGVAGSVLCLISFILNIFIQYTNQDLKVAVICGVTIFQGVGILLLIVSSNLTGQYYVHTYNLPLAVLFIEFGLLTINMMNLYVVYRINAPDGNVPGLLVIDLQGWPQTGSINRIQAR